MLPAQTKKNYSVKEAAKLLSVSTNTLYKYLEEGKLEGRRIGKGRFKISYKQLLPYMESDPQDSQIVTTPPTPAVVVETASVEPLETKEIDLPKVDMSPVSANLSDSEKPSLENTVASVKSGVDDNMLFRIFKGVIFIGLGIIYLFSAPLLSSFQVTSFANSGATFLKVLPLALILIGTLNLVDALNPKKLFRFHLVIDALSIIVLGYFSYISIISNEIGLFAFTSSFTVIAISHLVSGFSVREGTPLNFFTTFSRFVLIVVIIGGIMMAVYPSYIPIQTISEYVKDNQGFSAFLWFLTVIAPLIYLLSPVAKKSNFRLPYFVVLSTLSLIMATELTILAKWDLSYVAYLTGIFGLFLAWWMDSERIIDLNKIWITTISFFWISLSLIFGLFALNAQRNQLINNTGENMKDTLEAVVTKINSNFDERSSVLTEFSGGSEIKKVLSSKDNEVAISFAKTVYERIGDAERVLIYNKDGIAIGVYPRNSLFQGTNFSSRKYFTATVASYQGFISPIFEDVLGAPAVIQTEPIFNNNNFVGMIGVSLDLPGLAGEFNLVTSKNFIIKGLDNNNYIVFGSNKDQIGKKDNNSDTFNKLDILENQQAEIPAWKIVVSTAINPLASETGSLNIILSILLVINALFSVSAGVIASTKRKNEFSDKDNVFSTNEILNPGFVMNKI